LGFVDQRLVNRLFLDDPSGLRHKHALQPDQHPIR
jgi:hypothetical protein